MDQQYTRRDLFKKTAVATTSLALSKIIEPNEAKAEDRHHRDRYFHPHHFHSKNLRDLHLITDHLIPYTILFARGPPIRRRPRIHVEHHHHFKLVDRAGYCNTFNPNALPFTFVTDCYGDHNKDGIITTRELNKSGNLNKSKYSDTCKISYGMYLQLKGIKGKPYKIEIFKVEGKEKIKLIGEGREEIFDDDKVVKGCFWTPRRIQEVIVPGVGYGKFQVDNYINGKLVGSNQFEIFDSNRRRLIPPKINK